MSTNSVPLQLTRKDFVSDQTVRWCPGCGDYAILAQIQKTLPDIGVPKEDIVFISGIGCSSRFPYYMNTYGIHSIHGRAPTLATGLAVANPDLSIWVITGDGDGLSIGGNHLLHTMRRNVNLNIILFNNRVYGLTKGQYSPTSRQGHKSKSSPMGSIEQPLNPVAMVLAAEATFVARSLDAHTQHLGEMLAAAAAHKGISFIEVYQNCVIFNPNEWGPLLDRRERNDHIIYLEHGQPMVFGKNNDRGVRLNERLEPEVVALGDTYSADDLIVYDAGSKPLALMISSMEYPEFPATLGIIRNVSKPTYTDGLMAQVEAAQAQRGKGNLNQLYRSAELWEVDASEAGIKATDSGNGHQASTAVPSTIEEIVDTTPVRELIDTTPISELNPNTPVSVADVTPLSQTIKTMNQHQIGSVLVTGNGGKLVGIFTGRDVLTRVAGKVTNLSAAPVADFMTPTPITVQLHQPIAQALHVLSDNSFRHLPLVNDENQPQGIISFRDVVHYLEEKLN